MRRQLKNAVALCATMILGGCASAYRAPEAGASATISFDLTSDSTGTSTRTFTAWAYEDLSCKPSKYGAKLDSKALADAHEILGPTKVAGGSPFTFALSYIEARFAQNRECSYTASFVPAAGQTYAVNFAVVNQSLGCGLKITDQSGESVQYQSPEYSCAETMAGKIKNGGAGILDWKILP